MKAYAESPVILPPLMDNRHNPAPWRSSLPVLVVDAQAMGSIAVIRSLGRAGYPVHACSSVWESLGLRSRYATSAAVCPEYNDAKFIPWLRQYVSQNNIRALVPSEGLLIALRPNFEEFAELIPFGACARTIYGGLSKFDLF